MGPIFITGTDTGAGKTFVTGGIVAELRRRGIDALPAKPVQTGCVNESTPDLDIALQAAGISANRKTREELCPFRLEPECSPHLAAAITGARLDPEGIAARMESLAEKHECVVAEGAGGILVPLGGGRTMLDLMKRLHWPVILVCMDRLGAINHSLLSLQVLRTAGLEPCGIVFNHCAPPSELTSLSNRDSIIEYGATLLLGEVPFSPHRHPSHAFRETCEKLLEVLRWQ